MNLVNLRNEFQKLKKVNGPTSKLMQVTGQTETFTHKLLSSFVQNIQCLENWAVWIYFLINKPDMNQLQWAPILVSIVCFVLKLHIQEAIVCNVIKFDLE